MEALQQIFDGLMRRYQKRVPDVNKITNALIEKNIVESQADIENDHIAFRTIGVPQLGIAAFEKIFLNYGYERRDQYNFEAKKLNAYWYAPPEDHYPRIFISELRINEFPKEIQQLIYSYTNEIKENPIEKINLNDPQQVDHFLHTSLWRTPKWEDYQKLLKVSEYAAWVIYNRYYLNHYTITVNNLPPGYNTLEEFNRFLNEIGVKLNDSGGFIKKSEDGLLLQSSTVSQLIDAKFAEGDTHKIAGSYVEFAERKVLPEYENLPAGVIKRKHRREGFEASNADKIFESTFISQTQKNQ